MDIHDLRELILDIECMTVLRHVMEQPALAALYRLVCDCTDENVSEGELTYAYCQVYNAWLSESADGRDGFSRIALTAVLFEESPVAQMCARTDADKLPYSVISALSHDLQALGRLTAIEPAMFLLLCQRAGMSGKVAARLPMWEPKHGCAPLDPRVMSGMLSYNGAKLVAAFFRKHGSGLFASCPGSTWVGVSETYPLGLRGIREPDPIRLEDMVLYERERGVLVENTKRLLAGHHAANILLYGDKGTGKSATVKALLTSMWLDGLRTRAPKTHAAIAGAVLNSPWLDLQYPRLQRTVVKLATRVMARRAPDRLTPDKGLKGYGRSIFKGEHGDWDFDVMLKPVAGHVKSWSWLDAVLRAQRRVHRGIEVGVPCIVLHSDRSILNQDWSPALDTADAVLDVEQIRARTRCLGSGARSRTIPGARHDVFLSKDHARAQALSETIPFLDAVNGR